MAFKQQPLIQEHYTMKIIEDLGQVPSKSNPNRFYRHAIFECPVCNKHFEARATGAKAKAQESCSECVGSHKASYHPLYAIWNGIRQRCYNPNRKDFYRYGEVGVTMHQEWKDDVLSFITWCESNGWEPGLVIDKDIKSKELGINPPVYSPETLSFITAKQNAAEANGKKVAQFDLQDNFIADFETCVEAALHLGKPASAKTSISSCCRGVNHTAFGFKWKFI